MVAVHVLLSSKSEDEAETTSMGDRAESIIKIAVALSIFPVHMLPLDYEPYFAFVKISVLALDLIVEA
jgi:hypothetical protein